MLSGSLNKQTSYRSVISLKLHQIMTQIVFFQFILCYIDLLKQDLKYHADGKSNNCFLNNLKLYNLFVISVKKNIMLIEK